MMRVNRLIILIVAAVLLCGCYHNKGRTQDGQPSAMTDTANLSMLTFESTHHYSPGYNFIVRADSLMLLRQQPEELVNQLPTDTLVVYRHDPLVVADIRIISADPVDSVWVQVARDQATFGWAHESALLASVVPDDPISQFISTFSDSHLLIFLVVIIIIGASYLLRVLLKKNAYIVHFHDIDSIYPTLLTIAVASAATFYSSIQLFAPDMWRHFYYHPSLNPFSLPAILCLFICAVWAMLILCLAAYDDVKHQLQFGQATLYLSGLAAICAADYIIFSITTLYYVGYPLLIAYIAFAIYRYVCFSSSQLRCGNCGHKIQSYGKCPYCGAMNK